MILFFCFIYYDRLFVCYDKFFTCYDRFFMVHYELYYYYVVNISYRFDFISLWRVDFTSLYGVFIKEILFSCAKYWVFLLLFNYINYFFSKFIFMRRLLFYWAKKEKNKFYSRLWLSYNTLLYLEFNNISFCFYIELALSLAAGNLCISLIISFKES